MKAELRRAALPAGMGKRRETNVTRALDRIPARIMPAAEFGPGARSSGSPATRVRPGVAM